MSTVAMAVKSPALETELVRFKSVLVLTDFSEGSRKALEYAGELARRFGSTVHLLHAIGPMAVADYGEHGPGLVFPEVQMAAEQELHVLAQSEALKGVEHTEDLLVGPVSLLAEEMAAKYRVDLIVCATHAPGALERLTFGSVAEWVARGSACPCMLLGKEAEPRREMKRVLFATALKPDSLRSVQYAEGLAGSSGAALTVMHVMEEDEAEPEQVRDRMSKMLWKDLARGGVVVERGDVVKAILRQAEKLNADLIVMGLRNGRMAHHAPWATVSEVVAQARCPVLAVPEHFR